MNMNTELVSKKVEWVPGKGVRTHIKVEASIPHFSGMGTMMTMTYKHEIHIAGTDSPIVSLSVGTASGIKGGRDAWIAALHDWLATTDYVAEWEGEAAKYRHVVSQVDLPSEPAVWSGHIAYDSHGVEKDPHALTYKLMMGGIQFFLSVVVMAKYEGAVAYVGLLEPDDSSLDYEEYGTSYVCVGEVPLNYPITVDSVKTAIGPTIDTFLSKVGELASGPLVSEPPAEDFYDR